MIWTEFWDIVLDRGHWHKQTIVPNVETKLYHVDCPKTWTYGAWPELAFSGASYSGDGKGNTYTCVACNLKVFIWAGERKV